MRLNEEAEALCAIAGTERSAQMAGALKSLGLGHFDPVTRVQTQRHMDANFG